ncbi:MAG TPA: SDR family NAD(P)-dependent oxidoreductase [Mucilaginibacter sp.]|jgi:short-subunit dehydrogenase
MAKTIFITGASRGLGRIWAEAFLKRGDQVVVAVRNRDALSELSKQYASTTNLSPAIITASPLAAGKLEVSFIG